MKYQIVERESFQAVGVKRECSCGEDAEGASIAELWAEVNANGTVNRLARLINSNSEIKGLLGITCNYNKENNTIDYWIAAEHTGEVPSGLKSLEFPKSKWVVFEVIGSAPIAMPNAWKQIFSEWIPPKGYEVVAEIPAIEAYTDTDPYKTDASNQIWIAVK